MADDYVEVSYPRAERAAATKERQTREASGWVLVYQVEGPLMIQMTFRRAGWRPPGYESKEDGR